MKTLRYLLVLVSLIVGGGIPSSAQFAQIFYRAPTASDFCYSPTLAYDSINNVTYQCLLTTHTWGAVGAGSGTSTATIFASGLPGSSTQGLFGLSIPSSGLKGIYMWGGTNWFNINPYDSDARLWGCDNTGATGASACLDAMFTATATTAGQSINIPSGTYLIDTPLHIRREVVINGQGSGQDTPVTKFKLKPGSQIIFDKSTVSSDGGRGDWTIFSKIYVQGTSMSCTASTVSSTLTACNGDPSVVLGLLANDYVVGMNLTASLWRLYWPHGTQVASTTANSITLANGVLPNFNGAVTVMASGYTATSGTTSNGSQTITAVANPAAFQPGDPIQGPGISYPNFITGRNIGASTLTLFTAAGAGAGAGNLTKGPLANVAVHGGSVVLEDSAIEMCAGYCYDNNGSAQYTPPTIADGNYINRLRVFHSGDALVHFQGADSNAGTTIGVQGSYGTNGCLRDQSFLGNTHIGPQCSSSDGYPFYSDNPNASIVFINPYVEGGQKASVYSSGTYILSGANQGLGAGGGNNGNFEIADGRMSPTRYVRNLQGATSTATCTNGQPTLTNVGSISQWHLGDAINSDCLPSTTSVLATDGISVLTANKNAVASGDNFPITPTVTKLLMGQPNGNGIFGFGYSTNNSTEFDYVLEFDDPAYRLAGTYETGFWSFRYRSSGKAMSFPTDQSTNSDDQVISPGTTAPIKFGNGIRVGNTTGAPAIKPNISASAPTTGEWQNGSIAISNTSGLWQQRGAGKSVNGAADTVLGSTALANQNAAFTNSCTINDRVSGTGIQTGTILVSQSTLSKAATATNTGVTITCKRIAKAHLATTCDVASGTNTLLNCSTITGWAKDDYITGLGIPASTFISIAPSGSTITLSQNATLTNTAVPVSDAVFFKYLDAGASWSGCSGKGLGDGLNALAAGTYLQFSCVNNTGSTVTLTGFRCWTDNAGTSTLNAANNAGTGLLTGAVTCNNTKASGGAAGTQSATVTLVNGDGISFTFVADGTTKQTNWTVSGNN